MACPVCAWCGDPLFGEVHTLDRQQYHPSCATTYLHTSLNKRLSKRHQLTSVAIILKPIANKLYGKRRTKQANKLALFRAPVTYTLPIAP